MTPEEVEAKSQERARFNRARLYVLAAFVLVAMFAGAGLLQYQQNVLADLIEDQAQLTRAMCLQRQVNTLKSNEAWVALAMIETRNKFIDDDIRSARLAVYENALLIVPDCKA